MRKREFGTKPVQAVLGSGNNETETCFRTLLLPQLNLAKIKQHNLCKELIQVVKKTKCYKKKITG